METLTETTSTDKIHDIDIKVIVQGVGGAVLKFELISNNSPSIKRESNRGLVSYGYLKSEHTT